MPYANPADRNAAARRRRALAKKQLVEIDGRMVHPDCSQDRRCYVDRCCRSTPCSEANNEYLRSLAHTTAVAA